MGWFKSGENKKKKKNNTGKKTGNAQSDKKSTASKSLKSSNDDSHFGWVQARVYVYSFAALLAISLGIAGWVQAYPHMIDYVAQNHNIPIEITFANPVVNVDGVEDTLLERAYSVSSQNPYDANILNLIHREMVASHWFVNDTLQISRDMIKDPETGNTKDHIIINGDFRYPYALVRYESYDYLVDQEGVRLPVTYMADEIKDLLVITGAKARVPQTGTIWKGVDIAAGLDLIKLFYDKNNYPSTGRPWLSQVRAIDISNADGSTIDSSPQLVIVTARDGRIVWGRPVGREYGIEIPPLDKLRLLDLEYAERRRIDHQQGIMHINLSPSTVDH